ncbi:MAG TPA: VOC family protein [Kofleriaceae bacterium]|nr:VOC family protein [Kofleriaceae bacterium]
MNKLTPNLFVHKIEDVLPFYEKLGFTRTAEVKHGDHLGFVILACGKAELMLQTFASIAEDLPPIAAGSYRTMLYIEVDDLAPFRAKLEELVIPERTTNYGARELIATDPAGNVVAISHFEKK